MPTRKVLEDFLKGMYGKVTTYFDTEKGIFVSKKKGSVKKKSF